ncbi:MAG: VWA domain-containing protein [Acidobacteria bacterium]|nr:VWA domain-containing protein [Acidobacteriota bacterium]
MIRASVIALLAAAMAAGQPQVPTFRVETRVVQAFASVFDRRGNPIPNLSRERFRVLDAGREAKLLDFEGVNDPLSCALLLDVTGSMQDVLPALKASVMRFIDDMPEGGSVAVYTFNTNLREKQGFTTDCKAAKQAVMRATSGGATALFDSVSKVSHDLEQRKGKKALVVFTDGDDNASALSAESASRRARRDGVPLYVIAQGQALKQARLIKVLEELAADTGGIPFRLYKPEKMDEIFAEISRNLQHTYMLAWKLPEDAGSVWRPIRISVEGAEGAVIRTRQGYWPD